MCNGGKSPEPAAPLQPPARVLGWMCNNDNNNNNNDIDSNSSNKQNNTINNTIL